MAKWRSRRETVHFGGSKLGRFRRFGTTKIRRDFEVFERKLAHLLVLMSPESGFYWNF